MDRADLEDVAAGVLTPFAPDDTDEILHDELAANAEWLYEEGIRLFLACANIAEYHALSHEERIATAATVCEALPDDATVLAGAGGSTKTAIDLARAHEENGADGIMVMPPDHIFKHERGVVDYYHRLADAVDIGVVPYTRGMTVTVPQVQAIADHENVVGVKWAIHDVELFAAVTAAVEADVVWMNGMAEPPAPAYWLEGADAFSAGVTNFVPRLGLELFDALDAGEYERAKALRDLSVPFMNLRAETGENNVYGGANSVPAVKYGLELAGQYGGPVREPLVEMPADAKERAERCYEDVLEGLDELT